MAVRNPQGRRQSKSRRTSKAAPALANRRTSPLAACRAAESSVQQAAESQEASTGLRARHRLASIRPAPAEEFLEAPTLQVESPAVPAGPIVPERARAVHIPAIRADVRGPLRIPQLFGIADSDLSPAPSAHIARIPARCKGNSAWAESVACSRDRTSLGNRFRSRMADAR